MQGAPLALPTSWQLASPILHPLPPLSFLGQIPEPRDCHATKSWDKHASLYLLSEGGSCLTGDRAVGRGSQSGVVHQSTAFNYSWQSLAWWEAFRRDPSLLALASAGSFCALLP